MPKPQFPYFVRCIRGAEWICAAEIRSVLGVTSRQTEHRAVSFRSHRPLADLQKLRTADDAFLELLRFQDLDHTRATLATIEQQTTNGVRDIDPRSGIRIADGSETFEVVASFLGKRNYSRFEIEDAVGRAIESSLQLHYRKREGKEPVEASLQVRVHLSDGGGVLGIRESGAPLHRRPYKLESCPGTLHPPLAAAMVMLAGMKEGCAVLDTFCGAGTILIEAALLTRKVECVGTDYSRENVEKARKNASHAGVGIELCEADAGRLPFPDNRFDVVVCNPPWGRVVEARGLLARDEISAMVAEWERVLKPDGRAIVLIETDENVDRSLQLGGFSLVARWPVSLFGSWPSIFCFHKDGSRPVFDAASKYANDLRIEAEELDPRAETVQTASLR